MVAAIGDTADVNWDARINTVSGRSFYYLSDDVSEVDNEDIATALSRQPRWAGHTRQFYSVAQHSVAVSKLIKRLGGDVADQMYGLLHDATEAYMCDIPSPLKRMIPEFKRLELIVWAKISRKFFGEVRGMPQLVHDADLVMLATESRDLCRASLLGTCSNVLPEPDERPLFAVPAIQARHMFMSHFHFLRG